jgi:glucokinase
MSSLSPWLLGDIGATHARFAWVASDESPLSHVRTYPCDDFDGLQDAIQHYLKAEALGPPAKAALGVATPVTSDKVAFTNRAWTFSISALKKRLGVGDCLS